MRFQLLGCVQAWDGDQPVGLGVRKQRLVLAVLALEANRLVPTTRLVDLIWPGDPPASARGMVHTYISKLRGILDRHRATDRVELHGEPGGYELRCDPECVDVHQFRALTGRARGSGDDARRIALLDEALALWRGPALAGVGDDEVRFRLCHRVEEARLDAVEARFDALLRCGRHHEVIDELTPLSAEHQHRQRFISQLMLALHRAARTPEALELYDRARRRLADSSGLDPTDELQRLHQAILRADSTLAPRPPSMPVRPAQLPADLSLFTGRRAEVEQLLALRPAGNREPPAVVITAIDGMAGVGKTALAVHVAHRLAPHYPDGQLFVDLYGYTPDVVAVDPAEALDRLLRTLGVPGERIPAHLDDRAALWRTTLAGRRMLILLDNAAGEHQVRPLLPGTTGTLVLITSRTPLAGLHPTHPLSLDVLPAPEALDLFTRIAGPDRLAGHPPEPIGRIIELCGRLPLAIRIAATRLRARPGWTPGHLAERLCDQRHRLGELQTGGLSITATLDLSYRQLGPDQRRLYRLLGLHPGADLDAYAAAALAGTTVSRTRDLLDRLVDAHLITEPIPGRFRFHDLIRAHARHVAARDEPRSHRHAALTRLLDHYTRTATAAMDIVHPYQAAHRPDIWQPHERVPHLGDPRRATIWLNTELTNLLGTAAHAATHGWPTHAIHLSAILHRHLSASETPRALT